MMNRRSLLQGLSLSILSATMGVSPRHGEAEDAPEVGDQPVTSADRLRIAVIGPGSRGKELIRQFLRVPGVEVVAVADVYELRFLQVNELVGKAVPAYKDYRQMLERRDIDAVVVASPPLFHAQHVIDSIQSGRPVYGEKTMGFTEEDNYNIVNAVTQSGQIYQVGHQNRYAPWFQEAIRRIHEGEIGEPTHVYAYWFRRDNWRRNVPDPNLEHLINWRLYRESSGGLLEELGSHQIDVANWIFGEQPQTVLGSTSIVLYNDGRTVGDNVQAILGYSKGRRMIFSSLTDNAFMGDQLWVYGTNGSVQLTVEDATFYGSIHHTITGSDHTDAVRRGVKTGASYNYAADDEMPYRGPGKRIDARKAEDPTLTACRSFVHCVRTKTQPVADVRVGFGSAMACTTGKNAVFEGSMKNVPQWKPPAA